MSFTGFENYALSELERKAYQDQNFLAQEILKRLDPEVDAVIHSEKVKTKYVGESK